jgi:hypothetical protein
VRVVLSLSRPLRSSLFFSVCTAISDEIPSARLAARTAIDAPSLSSLKQPQPPRDAKATAIEARPLS